MPIGTITLGDYVTVTPDTSIAPYASLQGPSPSMPVVSDDILTIIQAIPNVQSMAELSSAVETVDGSGSNGVIVDGRFYFAKVIGTGSAGGGHFDLALSDNLNEAVAFVMNSGTGYLTVRGIPVPGTTLNTLQIGEMGIYRLYDNSVELMLVTSFYRQPYGWLITDNNDHTIDGLYNDQTVIGLGTTGATSATYTISGGTAWNRLRVVNSGFTDGIQLVYNGSNIGLPITAVYSQDLVFDGGIWRKIGKQSIS